MQTRVRYQVMVVLVVFVSMIAACGTGSPSSTVPPAESQGVPPLRIRQPHRLQPSSQKSSLVLVAILVHWTRGSPQLDRATA